MLSLKAIAHLIDCASHFLGLLCPLQSCPSSLGGEEFNVVMFVLLGLWGRPVSRKESPLGNIFVVFFSLALETSIMLDKKWPFVRVIVAKKEASHS